MRKGKEDKIDYYNLKIKEIIILKNKQEKKQNYFCDC